MKSYKNRVLLALVIALLLRLATYPFSNIERPAFFEYGEIATNLIEGNGYSMPHWLLDIPTVVPTAWMPPGQVLVLTAFFILLGKCALAYHLIFVLNAVLGVGAVYLLGRVTRYATESERLELVTLFAAAVFPPFVSASATWGVASSALFLNALVVLLAMRFSLALRSGHDPAKPAILFGLAAGVLALFRAEAPLTFALILLALVMIHRERLRGIAAPLLISGVVMTLVISPWLAFNYARFDKFIPGSSSGAYNLWRGNNPIASGGGWTAEGHLIYPPVEMQREIKEKISGLQPIEFEPAYNEELRTRALQWMKQNPGTVALLAMKKALLIWVVDIYHFSPIKYVYVVCQLLAFALAVFGVLSLRNRRLRDDMKQWLWISGAAALAMTLITMVFFSLPRYQIFLVGLYFPLVAIGIDSMLQRLRKPAHGPESELASL